MAKKISFEKSLETLEEIVTSLEEGELSLDEALKKYEEGIKLVGTCHNKLEEAKGKVELLVKNNEGSFKLKPFDDENEK